MSVPGGYSSESMLTGAGGAVNIVAMRGGASNLGNSIVFGGESYVISSDLASWDAGDSKNFLNYIGLQKGLFDNDEIYRAFAEQLAVCVSDSSSIDSKCDSVNAILYKAITVKIQEVFYGAAEVQQILTAPVAPVAPVAPEPATAAPETPAVPATAVLETPAVPVTAAPEAPATAVLEIPETPAAPETVTAVPAALETATPETVTEDSLEGTIEVQL
jgi:hypothetical protein